MALKPLLTGRTASWNGTQARWIRTKFDLAEKKAQMCIAKSTDRVLFRQVYKVRTRNAALWHYTSGQSLRTSSALLSQGI